MLPVRVNAGSTTPPSARACMLIEDHLQIERPTNKLAQSIYSGERMTEAVERIKHRDCTNIQYKMPAQYVSSDAMVTPARTPFSPLIRLPTAPGSARGRGVRHQGRTGLNGFTHAQWPGIAAQPLHPAGPRLLSALYPAAAAQHRRSDRRLAA